MCPWRKIKIQSYKEKWLNRDWMERIIDKDLALKKEKKNKGPEDIIHGKKLKDEVGLENPNEYFRKKNLRMLKKIQTNFGKISIQLFQNRILKKIDTRDDKHWSK